jgi:SAM-dependent methyltransferase
MGDRQVTRIVPTNGSIVQEVIRRIISRRIQKTVRRISRRVYKTPVLRSIHVWIKNQRALRALTTPTKLHLGCGSEYLKGYVNIDVEDWAGICDMVANATHLPMFPDNSVDHIFNHALLEHIPPWDTLPALQEWYRILRPGGTIQIEVPDLERIFEDWLVEGSLGEAEAINNIFGGNKSPDKAYRAQDHLTGFTFGRLTKMMAQVGFEDCERLEHDTYHHILVVHARKPMGNCGC